MATSVYKSVDVFDSTHYLIRWYCWSTSYFMGLPVPLLQEPSNMVCRQTCDGHCHVTNLYLSLAMLRHQNQQSLLYHLLQAECFQPWCPCTINMTLTQQCSQHYMYYCHTVTGFSILGDCKVTEVLLHYSLKRYICLYQGWKMASKNLGLKGLKKTQKP